MGSAACSRERVRCCAFVCSLVAAVSLAIPCVACISAHMGSRHTCCSFRAPGFVVCVFCGGRVRSGVRASLRPYFVPRCWWPKKGMGDVGGGLVLAAVTGSTGMCVLLYLCRLRRWHPFVVGPAAACTCPHGHTYWLSGTRGFVALIPSPYLALFALARVWACLLLLLCSRACCLRVLRRWCGLWWRAAPSSFWRASLLPYFFPRR